MPSGVPQTGEECGCITRAIRGNPKLVWVEWNTMCQVSTRLCGTSRPLCRLQGDQLNVRIVVMQLSSLVILICSAFWIIEPRCLSGACLSLVFRPSLTDPSLSNA